MPFIYLIVKFLAATSVMMTVRTSPTTSASSSSGVSNNCVSNSDVPDSDVLSSSVSSSGVTNDVMAISIVYTR